MASGKEVRRRSSISSSSVGLEALFPPRTAEQVCSDGDPELVRLREWLQGWLSHYEPLLLGVQRLLVWERPLYSVSVALTLNTLFWLLSSTSLKPLFLLSVSLLTLTLLERWRPQLPRLLDEHTAALHEEREQRLLSVPELSHHLAESLLTCCIYLQEALQYKRQNHGKFCMMMCSSCLVLAVLGHYVPGIMISYIIALSVLLWPLVVYHELIQRMYTALEPLLMKLDYSMKGQTQHHKHDKRKVKREMEEGDGPRAETESESEEELSCFSPTVDVRTAALAMAITDSELSDEEASILESGGFSVSRATTPQLTDVSEDLDQQSLHSEVEEVYQRDLQEFHTADDFSSVEQSAFPSPSCPLCPTKDDTVRACVDTNLPTSTSPMVQHLASPLHFVNTHFNGHRRLAGEERGWAVGRSVPTAEQSLEALSEEIVSTAISTIVQSTAKLQSSKIDHKPAIAHFFPTSSLQDSQESTSVAAVMGAELEELPDDEQVPTEEEDFELLDQSELEQVDLELSSDLHGVAEAPTASDRTPSHQDSLWS